jgi:hypothetical protein
MQDECFAGWIKRQRIHRVSCQLARKKFFYVINPNALTIQAVDQGNKIIRGAGRAP